MPLPPPPPPATAAEAIFEKGLKFIDRSKEIIEGLQKIKGIGIWSASIFALFYLQHHDVLVWGDSSIKKSIELLYNEGQELKVDRIIEITSKWEPFRSTACIVLWKWLDEGAIKFY